MSNRLVLGSFDNTYLLRVSRPGANVLNPSLPVESLAFDSRWTNMFTVVQSGNIRGIMDNVDMVGWMWYAELAIPASYSGLPLILLSGRPEYSANYKAATVVGDLFGGYDSSTRVLTISGNSAWWPNASDYLPWGYFYYHLLQV
jgi:hypothetical protein